MSIVTRETTPATNVTRIADWRPRYERVKRGELGHPVAEIKTAARTLYLTEAAIECGLREFAKSNGLTDIERAASIACAIRVFRAGGSAATAIQQGQKRAKELAWGAGPKVLA